MLTQLLWALALTALTVTLHTLYTLYVLYLLRRHDHAKQEIKLTLWQRLHLLIHNVVMLLILHCAETTLWAIFYVYENSLPDFPTALYFSMVSYATIGYGDIVLPITSRLVGATEGLVGTLMAGWSVALLVGILQLALKAQPQHSQ